MENFKSIKTFVFDMDGVLTDGSLLIFKGTEWLRRMHIRDGYALQRAIKKGYNVLIISGSFSNPVKERLYVLGVKDVNMMVENKKEILDDYIEIKKLKTEEILYMGDDIPDISCMQMAGLACCPADAVHEVKQISKYISPLKGGEGCVRDVIEKVLTIKGEWNDQKHTPAI